MSKSTSNSNASGSVSNVPAVAKGGLFAQAEKSPVLDLAAWPGADYSVNQSLENEQQR